jgi:protein regulator of cytokinesis 1
MRLDDYGENTPSTIKNKVNRSRLSAFTPVQPVLTPKETPQGSRSHVLLSPSRTLTESLNALASSTAQQLEEIWDLVGYTPQERALQLSELLLKFRDQCEQTIAEEQGVVETFRQTISDAKDELRNLGKSLRTTIDPKLLRDNAASTLTDELTTLEATLEDLRLEATAAKNDLMECKDYLLESHQALGRECDQKWNDIETDLTAERCQAFHTKVDEMKEELTTRTAAVIQLLRDCKHLMNDLGIDGQNSSSEFDIKIAGSLVRSKDSSFIMASKFESETCTGIHGKALDALTNRASELSAEKGRRKKLLQNMGAEIAVLWEQLRVPEDEQRAFTISVKGLGMDTIQKGEAELERMKSMKSTMLGKLVDEARQTIIELWMETNASDVVKADFKAIDIEDEALYSDELLDEHEDYIAVLQSRLEDMKPLIRIIERREEILRQRMEYEELQKDSDRLKQRGAAMAKQLMEEEKMARRIKKELPKLTKLLYEKLAEWNQDHEEDFQYNGEVYNDVMARQEQEWVAYKATEMQLKLQKKQHEQEFEENKFLGKTGATKTKPLQTKPLGHANRLNNTRSSSRARSHRDGPEKPTQSRGVGNARSRLTT